MKKIIIKREATERESEYIREKLTDYNLLTAPPNQEYIYKNINLVLRDDKNIFGGLLGKIYRACLHIDTLWISKSKRGLGYGKQLLDEAENIAMNEKCTFIHLDTFSFQAPEFYQMNGYEVYGVLDQYSDGVKRYYLKKVIE